MRQTILQIAVAATLTACAPTMVTQSTAPELALPSPLATSQINMPLDSIRVAAAIVDRLQGGTGLAAGVLFSTSAGQILDRAATIPEGFNWRDTALLQYAERNGGASRIAAGRLEFADVVGRRLALLFTVGYGTAAEPIEINSVQVAPAFAQDPAIVAYVLPAAALPKDASVAGGHLGLLRIAAQQGRLWKSAAGKEDQALLVFLLEQVSPSADFTAGVSKDRLGLGVFSAETRYLVDDGFRVAVIPAHYDPIMTSVYAKALFRPGTEVEETESTTRMIGVFPLSPALVSSGD